MTKESDAWLDALQRHFDLMKAEPDTLLPCVDEIAAQVHEGRFSEGHSQINYNTFADEYSEGQQYCRRIARKLLENFQIRRRAAPARCDAQSAKALDLLQISTCFRGVVCGLLPCACAETLAAALSETQPAHRALRDIISIAKDDHLECRLERIVKRAEEGMGE